MPWYRLFLSRETLTAPKDNISSPKIPTTPRQQKMHHARQNMRETTLGQHRIIPAEWLKHHSGGCGTASALPKCSIMSGCGTRIVLRGQKPLALCDRCPCFGSLFPPLAALTFAAFSIICAFGLAFAAPRSPYRHLELCGIAYTFSVISSRGYTLWGRYYNLEPLKLGMHRQNGAFFVWHFFLWSAFVFAPLFRHQFRCFMSNHPFVLLFL